MKLDVGNFLPRSNKCQKAASNYKQSYEPPARISFNNEGESDILESLRINFYPQHGTMRVGKTETVKEKGEDRDVRRSCNSIERGMRVELI